MVFTNRRGADRSEAILLREMLSNVGLYIRGLDRLKCNFMAFGRNVFSDPINLSQQMHLNVLNAECGNFCGYVIQMLQCSYMIRKI